MHCTRRSSRKRKCEFSEKGYHDINIRSDRRRTEEGDNAQHNSWKSQPLGFGPQCWQWARDKVDLRSTRGLGAAEHSKKSTPNNVDEDIRARGPFEHSIFTFQAFWNNAESISLIIDLHAKDWKFSRRALKAWSFFAAHATARWNRCHRACGASPLNAHRPAESLIKTLLVR